MTNIVYVSIWCWIGRYYNQSPYHIPVLQVSPLYPGWHSPSGHVPFIGLHVSLIQWQLLEQLFPNVPDLHSTKNNGNLVHIEYEAISYVYHFAWHNRKQSGIIQNIIKHQLYFTSFTLLDSIRRETNLSWWYMSFIWLLPFLYL